MELCHCTHRQNKLRCSHLDFCLRITKLEATIAELKEYRQQTEQFIGTHKLDLREFCSRLDALDEASLKEKTDD